MGTERLMEGYKKGHKPMIFVHDEDNCSDRQQELHDRNAERARLLQEEAVGEYWREIQTGCVCLVVPISMTALILGLVEGFGFWNSLYMSVYLATSNGPGNVLLTELKSRVFAIFLIPFNVISFFLAVSFLAGAKDKYDAAMAETKLSAMVLHQGTFQDMLDQLNAMDAESLAERRGEELPAPAGDEGGGEAPAVPTGFVPKTTITQLDFIRVILMRLGRMTNEEYEEILEKFDELDSDNSGSLNIEDCPVNDADDLMEDQAGQPKKGKKKGRKR